jgi:hypothetical protein
MVTYTSFIGFLYLIDDILEEHFLPVHKEKHGIGNPLAALSSAFDTIWKSKGSFNFADKSTSLAPIPKSDSLLIAFKSLASQTNVLVPDMKECHYFLESFIKYIHHISWYIDQGDEFYNSESTYRHCRSV